jgi:hypothetical protein
MVYQPIGMSLLANVHWTSVTAPQLPPRRAVWSRRELTTQQRIVQSLAHIDFQVGLGGEEDRRRTSFAVRRVVSLRCGANGHGG